MQIFGLPIANHTREETLQYVSEALRQSAYRRITTLNPEFLLLAEENNQFKNCLKKADFQVIDGAGLRFAFALGGGFLQSRFPGADLLEFILRLAEEQRLKIFFAMHSDGLSHADEVMGVIQTQYPNIQVEARDLHPEGFFVPSQAQRADIIVCNFGAPWQEYFLEMIRRNPGTLRLGIGVGGALDYLTGKVPRAPRLMRDMGLEWLWRLLKQPRRYSRILRATILFPIRLLFARM